MPERKDLYPVALAVGGAVLFGASAPAAKVLLGTVDPVALAGLLYLGSGIGLGLLLLLRRTTSRKSEAGLTLQDLPWLAGSVLAGGVAAPILLLASLQHTPAATASLLLAFECVATASIAALVFREAIGRRVWAAVGLITLASAVLAVDLSGGFGLSPGALGVIGACVLWGIDNNLTCFISARDPVAIGMVKGLGAGTCSLALALLLGRTIPGSPAVLPAMAIGLVCYGISIAMFILATRGMGAARTSTWFGIAPFAGALLSLFLFRELPGLQFIIAAPIMVAGAALLFGEHHAHAHIHGPAEHEHYFVPDPHHPFKPAGSYRHTHDEVRHTHPHQPDIHHRHRHDDKRK